MDVLDHEPASWFLLAEGEEMFLDVSCEGYSGSSSLLLELTADERRAFVLEGRAAVARIALEVAAVPEDFWDRQMLVRTDEVAEAIARFHDSG